MLWPDSSTVPIPYAKHSPVWTTAQKERTKEQRLASYARTCETSRILAPNVGKVLQSGAATIDGSSDSSRGLRIVPCDAFANALEIVRRPHRPADFHHGRKNRSRRCPTCSWLRNSPRCRAASPRFTASFLLEVAQKNILEQLVRITALLRGGGRQLCFKPMRRIGEYSTHRLRRIFALASNNRYAT